MTATTRTGRGSGPRRSRGGTRRLPGRHILNTTQEAGR